MSYLELPATGERMEIFGSGGAEQVAATLSTRFGYDVPVLGQVPLDQRLRIGGDDGIPIVEAAPETTAARVLTDIATRLGGRSRGLAGMQLGLAPAGRL